MLRRRSLKRHGHGRRDSSSSLGAGAGDFIGGAPPSSVTRSCSTRLRGHPVRFRPLAGDLWLRAAVTVAIIWDALLPPPTRHRIVPSSSIRSTPCRRPSRSGSGEGRVSGQGREEVAPRRPAHRRQPPQGDEGKPPSAAAVHGDGDLEPQAMVDELCSPSAISPAPPPFPLLFSSPRTSSKHPLLPRQIRRMASSGWAKEKSKG